METSKKAKDLACKPIYFIDGLANARNAVELMKNKNVHALLINKRNNEDAHGIITVTDILKGIVIQNKTLDEVSVYEIMTKPVLAISSELNAKYVPKLMLNYNIKIAAVEENGELIGLIDLSQCLFALLDK